jgi:phosphoglycolate phosphatase-like HAD superfamily hydrolase
MTGRRDRLVLFDIDETLIDSGRAGTRALNRAFLDLFGIKDAFKDIRMAGMTDIQIMKEGLRVHGLSSMDGEVDAIVRRYLRFLSEEIENPWRRVKPGVFEFLEALKEEGIPFGLLTGNLEEGARIKLRPFGLDAYFPAGAFGSDDEDRDRLLPIAIRRFSTLGVDVSPEDCIIIGDTPRDVRCAKAHGARCIAVATGPYSRDSLTEAGADLVVDTLNEREVCLDFIKSDHKVQQVRRTDRG